MLRVAGLLVVLVAGACSRGEDSSRVIILGLDGLDPQTIDQLMSEGQLPNFARLRQQGAYGRLKAEPPLLSPVLWTTMATGKTPDQHGIGHFVAIDPASGAGLPVTSAMRKVEAVWTIASRAGRRPATVGWWATWPPEPIDGWVVSDHTCYHFLFRQGESGGSGSAVTHPPELIAQIEPLIRRPGDVSFDQASRFIDVGRDQYDRPFDFADEISHFRWALATAESYADIGLELWQRNHPELLMVYIEGTDSISHLYGHLFRAQGLEGELEEQQQMFGRAVEEAYRYADRLVGRYLAVMDSRTTLLVVSDHGFKLGELHDDPSRTRDLRRISERFHREDGILYLYGDRVRRHARIDRAGQLDITPTVLALLGLDIARDMSGRLLVEALELEPPPRQVASYETGERELRSVAGTSGVNDEILDHLQSLGYLEGGEVVSPGGDRTLAAIHFKNGHFEDAAEIYRRLIEADPNEASLRTSLAGCLGAMGRYPDALAQLELALDLDPINVEAVHNRAVIHERLDQPDAAIKDYRSALRYDPGYEPSRRALVRLTGSAVVRAPRTAGQAAAAELSERAGLAARRGAYQEAMALLDEAEKTAPGYVVVYQYRANIAYLMYDLEAAERALRKALELEPDNALFRHNLDNLLASKAKRAEAP